MFAIAVGPLITKNVIKNEFLEQSFWLIIEFFSEIVGILVDDRTVVVVVVEVVVDAVCGGEVIKVDPADDVEPLGELFCAVDEVKRIVVEIEVEVVVVVVVVAKKVVIFHK